MPRRVVRSGVVPPISFEVSMRRRVRRKRYTLSSESEEEDPLMKTFASRKRKRNKQNDVVVDDLGFDADVDEPTLFASFKSRNRARIMELNMDNNKIGSKLNHVGRGHLQSLHLLALHQNPHCLLRIQ